MKEKNTISVVSDEETIENVKPIEAIKNVVEEEDDQTLVNSDSEVENISVIPGDTSEIDDIISDVEDIISKDLGDEDKTTIDTVIATTDIQSICQDFTISEFIGDYGLDEFLEQGGSNNDKDAFEFILNKMGYNITNITTKDQHFACSTISSSNINNDGYLFGRNYDLEDTEGLVLISRPETGYASISTVDTHIVQFLHESELPPEALKIASLFIPLDGINEKGLSISVNAVNVPDDANPEDTTIHQVDPTKGDITTGVAIRMILNKAATVDEAIALLQQYNLHASLELLIHFHIIDPSGKGVVVEYYKNKIYTVETKTITNYYLIEGVEQPESKAEDTRDEIIMSYLNKYQNMTINQIKHALNDVSYIKPEYNYGTQWSVIYDNANLEATYFFKRNYEQGYRVQLEK